MIKTNSIQQFKTGSKFLLDNSTIKDFLQYSEYPLKLKNLLKKLTVKIEVIGYQKYFDTDQEKRIILNVTIIKDQKEISFDYGMSYFESNIITFNESSLKVFTVNGIKKFDTYMHALRFKQKKLKEIYNNLLYSILAYIRLDYDIPTFFEDFCLKFGYNEDSIKDKKLHEKCLKQSYELHKIFNDKDIECLPK